MSETARIHVKATRSELLKLRKRIQLAVRGHDLLEEKRLGLMRKFMELIHVYKREEKKLNEVFSRAVHRLMLARIALGESEFNSLFVLGKRRVFLEVKEGFVMNVKAPSFELVEEGVGKNVGASAAPLDVDLALKEFTQALSTLVVLAEVEKKISLLAPEAERTRRRVNALKHVIIPRFQQTAKYIDLKLTEMERSSFATLMRLKETVLA